MPGRREVHAPRGYYSRRGLAADPRYSEREDPRPRHHDGRVPNSFEARDANMEGGHEILVLVEVVGGGPHGTRHACVQQVASVSNR